MKVFIDEQLDGVVNYLSNLGYEVIRAKEIALGVEDKSLVQMAKENGWVFVTEDSRAAEYALSQGVEVVHLHFMDKAYIIGEKLKELEQTRM